MLKSKSSLYHKIGICLEHFIQKMESLHFCFFHKLPISTRFPSQRFDKQNYGHEYEEDRRIKEIAKYEYQIITKSLMDVRQILLEHPLCPFDMNIEHV